MTPNPYRAPLLPAGPPAAATFHSRAAAPVPPAAEGRARRVHRVRSGIWTALAGHGLALTLPLLPATLTGDPGPVYAIGGVVAQLLLAAFVVVLGVARTVRRDGANGVGLAIGWIAGVPVAAIAGLTIAAALAA